MRKRMESLRLDAEKTEQMLKERGKALDLQMKTLEARGVAQIMLELEVDRLYRFKELHSYSMVTKTRNLFSVSSLKCVNELTFSYLCKTRRFPQFDRFEIRSKKS
ncbi:hypothetical protein LINPERHAP1_LOCUS12081 [Linum perenne]